MPVSKVLKNVFENYNEADQFLTCSFNNLTVLFRGVFLKFSNFLVLSSCFFRTVLCQIYPIFDIVNPTSSCGPRALTSLIEPFQCQNVICAATSSEHMSCVDLSHFRFSKTVALFHSATFISTSVIVFFTINSWLLTSVYSTTVKKFCRHTLLSGIYLSHPYFNTQKHNNSIFFFVWSV